MAFNIKFYSIVISVAGCIIAGLIIGCILYNKASKNKKLGPFAYRRYIGLPTMAGMLVGFLIAGLLEKLFFAGF